MQPVKKLGKKGSFDLINTGMISFIGFMLVVILVILLVSTVKTTSIVCKGTVYGGACYTCALSNFSYTNISHCCVTTGGACYGVNTSTPVEYTGDAYNASKDLAEASLLPPQFAQIIVITLIIVGVLGVLSLLGYNAYKRMKN